MELDIHPSGRPRRSEHARQIPARYQDEIPPVAEMMEQWEPANDGQGTGMDIDGNLSSNVSFMMLTLIHSM